MIIPWRLGPKEQRLDCCCSWTSYIRKQRLFCRDSAKIDALEISCIKSFGCCLSMAKERPIVPPEMQKAADEPPDRDFSKHPYLKRMQFRGGGYAILMAFHLRSKNETSSQTRDFMYKCEIVPRAQAFCDVSMEGGWGSSSGWSSIRSLVSHRLLLESRGPGQRQEYRLTDEGKDFIKAMLSLWPETPINQGMQEAAVPSANSEVASVPPATQGVASIPPANLGVQEAFVPPANQAVQEEAFVPPAHQGVQEAAVASTKLNKVFSSNKQNQVVNEASPGCVRDAADRSRTPRPRWLAQSLKPLPAAAPTPFSATRASKEPIIEVDSDSQEQALSTLGSSISEKPKSEVFLVVDDRERLKDAEPRRFFEMIAPQLSGAAYRRQLKLGDFAWVLSHGRGTEHWQRSLEPCELIDCLVERKRIADLVGRSAVGDHMKQLEARALLKDKDIVFWMFFFSWSLRNNTKTFDCLLVASQGKNRSIGVDTCLLPAWRQSKQC